MRHLNEKNHAACARPQQTFMSVVSDNDSLYPRITLCWTSQSQCNRIEILNEKMQSSWAIRQTV